MHRLVQDVVLRVPVTGIVAPAAFGKTTLLVGWLRSGQAPHTAYLSLDVLDNDPKWFWSRLAAALESLRPGTTHDLPAPPDVATEAQRYLRSLTACFAAQAGEDDSDSTAEPEPVVVVLDELERLENPAVLELLGQFLLDLPAGLRVVLSGRTESNVRRGLLRARGQLVDIAPGELAFNRTEVAALLAKVQPRITPEETAAIATQSEGWVGAIKLAVLGAAGAPDPHALIHRVTGSNPYVADLLNTEVYAALSDEVRDFLLRTAVLDDFDLDLCDAVTRQSGSGGAFDQLRRSGLIVPADDGSDLVAENGTGRGLLFRYQRLFRDFLRHRLGTVDPHGFREAHRSAAVWFEEHGDRTSAIRHLLAGDDPADAVRVILEHGGEVAANGGLALVRHWLGMLPDEVLTRDPHLLAEVSGLCVRLGMRDDSEMWLERARWRVDEASDRQAATEIAVLTSYTRGQAGYMRAAIDDANRALQLASHTDDPEPTTIAKVHHLLAMLYTGLDEFDYAVRHRQAAPNSGDNEFPAAAYSSWLSHRVGQLTRSLELADAHLRRNPPPWQRSIAFATRGATRRERNQLVDAEDDLLAAVALSEQWSRPYTWGLATIELALLRHAQGRFAEAHDLLAAARVRAEGNDLLYRIDVTDALLHLRERHTERAVRLRHDVPTGRLTRLLDVRIALATGSPHRAAELTSEAEADARSVQDQIATKLLRARFALSDDPAVATELLAQAVELGREEGFIHVFLDDIDDVASLLRRLVADRDDPYVFGLLAAVATGRATTAKATGRRAAVLSTREQAILRYLPTSLANRDIADELNMSVNTLKTHLKSINRKLGTTSRAEAVSVARSLTLI